MDETINEVRGEFCILVAGSTEEPAPEEQWWESISVYNHIEHYINEKGMNSKEAIKTVAKDRDLSKRDVGIKSIMSIKNKLLIIEKLIFAVSI